MRSLPKCPSPPHKEQTDTISKTFEVKVITPLFGGGAKAGEIDSDMPIRGSSVRGHLRFWWRATRGAESDTVTNLREEEGRIWGTTKQPSPVSIHVENVSTTGRREPRSPRSSSQPGPYGFDRFGPEAYVLFSARQSIWREGTTFEIKVTLPKDSEKDVQSALWAWFNFGGIGARTRRGLGALYCRDFAPTLENGNLVWEEPFFPKQSVLKPWPTLPSKEEVLVSTSSPARGPLEAWNRVIGMMKQFRQGVDIGRDPGHDQWPGRSRWPEPESIRELSQRNRQGQHPRDDRIPVEYFPRAEFGLPIIFEIRGEKLKPTLQPGEKIERMGSPVILRPIGLTDGRFVPAVVRLSTHPLDAAYLSGAGIPAAVTLCKENIRNECLVGYPDSPLHKWSKTGSALEGFMNFAKKQGFRSLEGGNAG